MLGWEVDGCVDKGCVLLTWCIVRRVKLMWMRGGRIYRIIEVWGRGEGGSWSWECRRIVEKSCIKRN